MPPARAADPDLAHVLRSLRKAQGRAQEDVAHAAGISVNSLRRIESRDTNPTWTTVRSIANALGITLTDLGREVDDQPRTP
jgi:transcriptional regulator with XRE-family HTH domain